MLMIKYFLIWVITVVTSIICERTWSQVTYETCRLYDTGFISDQRGVAHSHCLCSVCSKSRRCAHWQSSDGAALFRLHTKKNVTTSLKLHHWGKNSISEKCNYFNFQCWKPALIIMNCKFWIRIFLGSLIDLAGCKVKSTFNLYFIL